MGALTDLKLPRSEIPIFDTGQVVSVRGLAYNDLILLGENYGPKLDELYNRFVMLDDLPSREEIARVLLELAPEMIGPVIAMAADDPDGMDIAAQLPIPVQTEVLQNIASLTFHSEAELKKTLELAILCSNSLTKMIVSLAQPELLESGFGTAELKSVS